MKKRMMVLILALMLVFALCGCKDKNTDKSTDDEAAAARAEVSGTYTTVGMILDDYKDYTVSITKEEGVTSTIVLNEDGTAELSSTSENSTSTRTGEWSIRDNTITFLQDEQNITGTVKDGVLEVYIRESATTLIYAKEDADLSSYEMISQKEFTDMLAEKK